MINWTKEFETGFEKIDLQHRMLITNINHLEELLNTTNPNKEDFQFFGHLVDFLEAYADSHFKQEEECMESHRCPAHARNKQAHENFREFFHQYKKHVQLNGHKVELLRTLHKVCDSWIREHILMLDTQLRACSQQ